MMVSNLLRYFVEFSIVFKEDSVDTSWRVGKVCDRPGMRWSFSTTRFCVVLMWSFFTSFSVSRPSILAFKSNFTMWIFYPNRQTFEVNLYLSRCCKRFHWAWFWSCLWVCLAAHPYFSRPCLVIPWQTLLWLPTSLPAAISELFSVNHISSFPLRSRLKWDGWTFFLIMLY